MAQEKAEAAKGVAAKEKTKTEKASKMVQVRSPSSKLSWRCPFCSRKGSPVDGGHQDASGQNTNQKVKIMKNYFLELLRLQVKIMKQNDFLYLLRLKVKLMKK